MLPLSLFVGSSGGYQISYQLFAQQQQQQQQTMSAPAYCTAGQLTDSDRKHLEDQICLFVKRDAAKAGLSAVSDHKKITLNMNAEATKLGGKDGLVLKCTGNLPVESGLSGSGDGFEIHFSCQKKGANVGDWEMRQDLFKKVDAGFAGEKL